MQPHKDNKATVKHLDISKALPVIKRAKYSMVVPSVEEHLMSFFDGKLKNIVLFGLEVSKLAYHVHSANSDNKLMSFCWFNIVNIIEHND